MMYDVVNILITMAVALLIGGAASFCVVLILGKIWPMK